MAHPFDAISLVGSATLNAYIAPSEFSKKRPMKKQSAGLLMYRWCDRFLQVFLVHPGGPFWKNKDAVSWSIPKGEYSEGEDPLRVAKREFEEETGFIPRGKAFTPLTPLRQPGGKIVRAWAVEGDCDASAVKSNSFSMEWPPRSGETQEFPEVDRAEWFAIEDANVKILKGQIGFLEQLKALAACKRP